MSTEQLTYTALRERISPLIPPGIDRDEVTEGVLLALTPSSERQLPFIKLKDDALYAWSEEDASATKLGLELLGETITALLADGGLVSLGMAIKDIVSFLIDLRRHHTKVADPLQIKVLLVLRKAATGLTAIKIRERLGAAAPTLVEVEDALRALAKAESRSGPRPLVRDDQTIWKILI